jgi:multidrug efflux pump subunit AcrA (membrane-fusion protein)
VVAPFDGVVTQRNVDVGSLVQADAASGTFMFTLMQTKVIRIQVFVPQDRAFGLGPGVEAVVRVPEIPDRTFTGTVTRIADALQPGTRTLLTEIDVPNTDGTLAPAIYCTVELHIPRKVNSVLVPSEAIRPAGHRRRQRHFAYPTRSGGAGSGNVVGAERWCENGRPGGPQSRGQSGRR